MPSFDGDLHTDEPIASREEDLLGRSDYAKCVAQFITQTQNRDGFVIGIHGEWGSGKSSLVNLILENVRTAPEAVPESAATEDIGRTIVVRFNCWWYSGADEVLFRLLHQIAETLGRQDDAGRLRDLADKLYTFALALTPLKLIPGMPDVAGVAGAAADGTRRAFENANVDAEQLKTEITKILGGGSDRLLVVIDDIDRLSPAEVCNLFRTVKAVANFPSTTYLLVFDKLAVARSIRARLKIDGSAYVDKIVQLPIDIPDADPAMLGHLLTARLDTIVADWQPFDRERWLRLYHDGLRHLLTTPRAVKRYLNAIRFVAATSVRHELNPVDVLGIEGLRMFAPEVCEVIAASVDAFTGLSDGLSVPPQRQKALTRTYAAVERAAPQEHKEKILSIAGELFPKFHARAGQQWHGASANWRRDKRICSPEIFPIYFGFSIPSGGIGRSTVESLIAVSDDATAVETRLVGMLRAEPQGALFVRNLLERIEDHTGEDIPLECVPSLLRGLFDAADELVRHDPPRGMLIFGMDMRIGRLAYQLLIRMDDAQARADLLLDIVGTSKSVATVVQEVSLVEHHWEEADKGSNDYAAQVPQDRVQGLKDAALRRLHDAASDGTLMGTPRLASTLWSWRKWEGDGPVGQWVNGATATDEGLGLFIQHMAGQGTVHVMGSYEPRYYAQVDRGFIEELLNDAQGVETRARAILSRDPPEALREALEAYLNPKKRH